MKKNKEIVITKKNVDKLIDIKNSIVEYHKVQFELKKIKKAEAKLKDKIKALGVGKVTIALEGNNLQVDITSYDIERKTLNEKQIAEDLEVDNLDHYKETKITKGVRITFREDW